MIASLPMYDLPPSQGANDRFWQAIRQHLGQGPDRLTRDGDLWDHWLADDLILSQTCGYPFRAHLHDKVTLVGTPDYALPGCPPGHYNSVFVARRKDARDSLQEFAGERFAYNEALSQSGWAAPMVHLRALGVGFDDLVQTGGHRASARAVAEGRADIAALDALTWKMICRDDGFTAGLKELGRTTPTPVLPYITSKQNDPAPIYAAIEAVIEDMDEADREMLSLRGIVAIPAETYLAVPTPPAPGEE
ncbi:phosphate/phosphite/phosphonate ABC transporter substrate-binding protein [Roseovarius sp. 2305UL8-3]|uniref:phosphate/phosphite/phosphonate ABC transporter substrate-binding protein n=1 Tax=Roseovarius conchicola TaxID=3121636 RepID=UPI0035283515